MHCADKIDAWPHDPDIVLRTAEGSDIDVLCEIDADACVLFERAGLYLDLPPTHEFNLTERRRWLHCIEAGTTLMAVTGSGRPVGFAAAGILDAAPYLDQLSVRTQYMRRGIGSALLAAATQMTRRAGGRVLWLTTYGHLSWNRPFYERHGFDVVSAADCGTQLADEVTYQKRWLPSPEKRVVMRRILDAERKFKQDDGTSTATS